MRRRSGIVFWSGNSFYAKNEDAASALELKKALIQYDRTLLVADPRRMEPKKVRLSLSLAVSCGLVLLTLHTPRCNSVRWSWCPCPPPEILPLKHPLAASFYSSEVFLHFTPHAPLCLRRLFVVGARRGGSKPLFGYFDGAEKTTWMWENGGTTWTKNRWAVPSRCFEGFGRTAIGGRWGRFLFPGFLHLVVYCGSRTREKTFGLSRPGGVSCSPSMGFFFFQ
jgi:hypothetical protein